MSPSGTATATLMQATRLDIPVQVLEQFAHASALDASILEDLRAAVVELHDRMQYRTHVLGSAATSLNTRYNQLREHVERTQQSVEAHTRTLQNPIAENQGLRSELIETRTHLADAREELQNRVLSLEGAQLSTTQWQAQVEAHIAKIEVTLTEMHERQRRNDERSEAVYQACTSAVGNIDPATQIALETLAGRVDELDSIARKAVQDSSSSQKKRRTGAYSVGSNPAA